MFEKNLTLVEDSFKNFQETVCHTLEAEEPEVRFKEDHWQYEQGGGGATRLLKEGIFLEQAAVNFSHVLGKSLPLAATQLRPELKDQPFEALGVSIVIHPRNPFIPATHANFRLLSVNTKNNGRVWWFGGGFDLTPYYPTEEDCIHWHQTAYEACLPYGPEVYSSYKQNCDNYFFLKHRQENRGIGGIFFDDLNEQSGWSFETCFDFVSTQSQAFLKAYMPIFKKNQYKSYTEKEKQFQLLRRGRYVEFNLLYDRGTLFGLQSCARTESILVSLPPNLRFEYNWQPEPNSPEEALCKYYLIPRDWLGNLKSEK